MSSLDDHFPYWRANEQQAGGGSHQPVMVYPVYWSPRTSSIVCWKFLDLQQKAYCAVSLFDLMTFDSIREICEVVCFVFFLNVWRTIYGSSSKMTCTQRYCKYVCIQNLWKDSNSSVMSSCFILCHEQNCRSQRKTCHFTLNCTDSGVELAAYMLLTCIQYVYILVFFLNVA